MKSSILFLSTLLALATAAPVPEAGPVLGFGGWRCQMRGGKGCRRDVETSAPVENIVKRGWRCQITGGRAGCNKRDVETSAPAADIVERDVSGRDISEHDLTKRRGPRKTCGPPTGRRCKKDVETSAPAEDIVERDVSEQDLVERHISEQDITKRNRWHGRPCGKQFGIKC